MFLCDINRTSGDFITSGTYRSKSFKKYVESGPVGDPIWLNHTNPKN